MAKDFLGWSKWSPHVGNAITIVLGVPALMALIAGAWAYVSSSGISVFLVVLAVFMMALWCGIGIVWLNDRAASGSRRGKSASDCAWGLRVEGVNLLRDTSPSAPVEWQFQVVMVNQLSWPLRIEVESQNVVLEQKIPESQIPKGAPHILMPTQAMAINFPGYKHGEVAEKERWKGVIDVGLKYGHPDGAYTRRAVRKFAFEQIIIPPPPTLPQGFQMSMIPVSGRLQVNFWSREQDRDEPITIT